jgi:hypothetical protein
VFAQALVKRSSQAAGATHEGGGGMGSHAAECHDRQAPAASMATAAASDSVLCVRCPRMIIQLQAKNKFIKVNFFKQICMFLSNFKIDSIFRVCSRKPTPERNCSRKRPAAIVNKQCGRQRARTRSHKPFSKRSSHAAGATHQDGRTGITSWGSRRGIPRGSLGGMPQEIAGRGNIHIQCVSVFRGTNLA